MVDIQTAKTVLSNPLTWLGLWVGALGVAWGFKMNTSYSNLTLACSVGFLMVAAILHPWLVKQPKTVHALWVLGIGAASSLGVYYTLWTRKTPIELFAHTTSGNSIVSVWPSWSPKFTEVTLLLINSSDTDFKDLDCMVVVDRPVSKWGCPPHFAGVSIAPNGLLAERVERIRPSTGERIVFPLVLIATSRGVRVRCETIPRRSHIPITLAAVEVDESRSIIETNGIIGFKNQETGVGVWYAVAGFSDAVFLDKPSVQKVTVEGHYLAEEREHKIKKEISVRDIVGDAYKKMRLNASPTGPTTNDTSQPIGK